MYNVYIFNFWKHLFFGYIQILREHFIILQTLWERYFWKFYEHFKASSNFF